MIKTAYGSAKVMVILKRIQNKLNKILQEQTEKVNTLQKKATLTNYQKSRLYVYEAQIEAINCYLDEFMEVYGFVSEDVKVILFQDLFDYEHTFRSSQFATTSYDGTYVRIGYVQNGPDYQKYYPYDDTFIVWMKDPTPLTQFSTFYW